MSSISDALAPTALGIWIAVLAWWIYHHFREQLEMLDAEMNAASLNLPNECSRNRTPMDFLQWIVRALPFPRRGAGTCAPGREPVGCSMHQEMKRGVNSLATIASSAPLLVLLAAVGGIVGSFKGCGCSKESELVGRK